MNTNLIMLAEFGLVLLLYLLASFRAKISPAMILLVFGVFAQVTLVEIKIGPVSLRIYIVLLLLLLVATSSAAQVQIRRVVRHHSSLFTAIGLFLFWVPLADLIAGRVVEEGFSEYGKGYLSDYIAAVMFLLACLGLVRRKADASFFAIGLVVVAGMSALFAIAQYFNIGIATAIHESLYAFEIQKRRLDGTYGRHHVSGLSSYSIGFVYTLITFMPLAYAYALIGLKKSSISTAVLLGLFLTAAVSVVVARSRSGLLGFGMAFLLITLFAPRIFKNIKVKNYLQIGLAVFIVLGVGYYAKGVTSKAETKYEDFNRLGNMWDQKRVDFAIATLEEVVAHPFVGIGGQGFRKKYIYDPHNTILNSAIYFGFFGLAFCLFYHVYLIRIGLVELRRLEHLSHSWVILGSYCGLMIYTFNGLTHNASFITGGVFGYIILGLFLATLDINKREASSARSFAQSRASFARHQPAVRQRPYPNSGRTWR